jgi:methylated-DNA-[protein]-cysteine S-methyltransferase
MVLYFSFFCNGILFLPMQFSEKVKEIVRNIPQGQTMTYKEVAQKAGNPKASRGVGAIMRANLDPAIPCHRVIKSDGTLGSYNRGGESTKKALLIQEGAYASR